MKNAVICAMAAAALASASPATTPLDQIAAMFCGQMPSCYDYPVLPPALPPIPEAPGDTLGPYVPALYEYGVPVADYPGTLAQFVAAEVPASEDWWENDGYAGLSVAVSGGYLFQMEASPESVSSIDPAPEPTTWALAVIGLAAIGLAPHVRRAGRKWPR